MAREMEIQIISRDTISPSTPTPHHLKSFKLSSLDQQATSNYVTIILFYPPYGDDDKNQVEHLKRSDQLKKSLSETLTHFYPVAGRIINGVTLYCNDKGVEFLEARVKNTRLSEFLKQPNIDDLSKFLPCDPYVTTNEALFSNAILAIQTTYFDCGGIALGFCFSHKIADGASMATFINCWASTAINGSAESIPNLFFDMPSLFPAKDSNGLIMPSGEGMVENIVTRRFIFDGKKIDAMRGQMAVSNTIKDSMKGTKEEYPTRVEAVSAFIWKHAMRVARARTGSVKASAAMHAVNLRGRMVPILPKHSFGNVSRPTITAIVNLESETESHVLVQHLRDAIRGMDGDYVRKLQCGEEGFVESIKAAKKTFSKEELLALNFNSWCRFPFYEADFGWGKPVWVATTKTAVWNLVILIDTRCGGGIEAWLNMMEEDMVQLEHDQEFLSFVSFQ